MSSTLTRAIMYGLVDELDELYEFIAEIVADCEDYEADTGQEIPNDLMPLIRLFNAVEGAVAVYDSAGGHEHGDPGELDSKGGFRNG